MQVEVNVENCLGETTPPLTANLELSHLDPANSITATTTWETWLTTWLSSLQSELPPALNYELSLRLTTDPEIQVLNAQYRHQNQPTDVLAFAALEVECPQFQERSLLPLYLGDIVISVDTAQRQAQQQGHNLLTELAWLAAHGLLHLLGWDHPDEDSLMSMLAQQAILLQKIGLDIDLGESWRE